MKRTTQTISWILVLSALTVAACGDRSESRTRIRKGDGGGAPVNPFNDKLGNADKALSGYWIQESPPSTEAKLSADEDKQVARMLYWKIDVEKKELSANLLCELESSAKGVVANGLSSIQVNAEQLVLRHSQEKSVPLDGPTDSKTDCRLNEKKASLTYTLDGDHLNVVDQTDQTSRKFCRATWDVKHQRPLPGDSCAKANDSSLVADKSQLPEVTDLNEADESEAKSTLKSEGEISEKILTPATRWKHVLPEHNGISSFLTMDLQKSADGELFVLSKTCYFTKEIEETRVDIQVNPKAIFSGKAIRIIEEKSFKAKAEGKKPACELTVSKQNVPYILANDKLTLQLNSGTLSFDALKAKDTTKTSIQK